MSEVSFQEKISAEVWNSKTIYVGSGAPSTTYDGQFWVDISTDPPVLKLYDDTNSQWMQYHPVYYETQAGAWANPSVTPVSNGTMVILYNSTQDDTRLYVYANDSWHNLDTAESPAKPIFSYSDTDITTDTVLSTAGIYYVDRDSSSSIEIHHSTEGWMNYNSCSGANGLVISDGTNVRITSTPNVEFNFSRTIPAGVSQADGSLTVGSNHVLPKGLIMITADSSDIQIQVNDGGWTDTGIEAGPTGTILVSDGVNMRLYNDGAVTGYYTYVYEVTS